MLSQLSLKTRISVPVVVTACAVFAALVTFQGVRAARLTKAEAFSKTEEMAHGHAARVEAELNVVFDKARTTAQVFEGLKVAGVVDRQTCQQLLRKCWTPIRSFWEFGRVGSPMPWMAGTRSLPARRA
jgi:methyl-accepting chemotaxis protein